MQFESHLVYSGNRLAAREKTPMTWALAIIHPYSFWSLGRYLVDFDDIDELARQLGPCTPTNDGVHVLGQRLIRAG